MRRALVVLFVTLLFATACTSSDRSTVSVSVVERVQIEQLTDDQSCVVEARCVGGQPTTYTIRRLNGNSTRGCLAVGDGKPCPGGSAPDVRKCVEEIDVAELCND